MNVSELILGEVCEINPRIGRDHGLTDADVVSFVPMAAVDEIAGSIRDRQTRTFGEVKKGFTYFRDGDVLFAKITPCMENGKATIARNLVGGIGFGSTEFHVLRAGGNVLPEWLFYFVRQEKFRSQAKRNFTGTAGQQRVPTTFLANSKILVPPLSEQRRILDLLSRADGIVRLRREAQQKASELVPAIFLEMFGDPASNPKGWPVVSLGEALSAADYGSSTKASDDGQGVPLIRMGNVGFDGNLDLSKLKFVQLDDTAVEKYVLRKGDILFNRTNSKDLVGKTGMWDGSMHAVIASYFIRLRANPELVAPTYLWTLMNGRHMKRVLFDTARGAIGQANINSKELKAFRIALPPLSLQKTFEQYVESVQSIRAQQVNASAKAKTTFDALLSRAFSI